MYCCEAETITEFIRFEPKVCTGGERLWTTAALIFKVGQSSGLNSVLCVHPKEGFTRTLPNRNENKGPPHVAPKAFS